MRKYSTLFVLHLNNALEYRGAIVSWMLVELLSLTSALFLWTGVFANQKFVSTYSYKDMLLYYFFIPVVGMISQSFITDWLPRKIKDGEIVKDIVKPYSFIISVLVTHIANRITQCLFKLPIYLIIGTSLFLILNPNLHLINLLGGLLFAVLAFFMHLCLDLSLSLLTFWFDDSWALSLLKYVAFLIFGGLAFPLSFVPESVRGLFLWLPFHLVYYLPTAIILNQVSFNTIIFSVVKCLAWGAFFVVLMNYLWHAGVRKYAAYGQ